MVEHVCVGWSEVRNPVAEILFFLPQKIPFEALSLVCSVDFFKFWIKSLQIIWGYFNVECTCGRIILTSLERTLPFVSTHGIRLIP